MNQFPIYVVIGTRAQLIKMAPVLKKMEEKKIDYVFIYTAQHRETIAELITEFEIKNPDIDLSPHFTQEAKTIGLFAGWILIMATLLLFKRRALVHKSGGILLTHGDTTTSAWAALLGKITRNRVMHIESGLTSSNILEPFPEELNRRIIFRLTDIFVCPGNWAIENISSYKGQKINTKANTLYDSTQLAIRKKRKYIQDIPKENYIVASIHRFENIFSHERLNIIIKTLDELSENFRVLFILHPSTKKQLIKNGYFDSLEKNDNIQMLPRMSYVKFLNLLDSAEFVVTDGGSNQEELSYLGKPTLLFRKATERTEGIGENIILSELNRSLISNFANTYKKYRKPRINLSHSPSQIIVDFLQSELENEYGNEYVKKYRKKRGEGRLERIIPLLKLSKEDNVLDVGCGNGFLLELISSKVSNYTGLDTSKEFIDEAINIHPTHQNNFLNEDVAEHSKTRRRYDKLFLMDVTDHIDNQNLSEILKACKKLLKKKGKLYIHTPNLDYFMEVFKDRGILPQTSGHIAVRNAEEYRTLLKKAGFSSFKISYLAHYQPLLKNTHILSAIPIIGKYFRSRIFIEAA